MGQVDTKSSFSKVPEITVYFWIIKVLCTTVGETAADFLNVNLNLGLTGTSLVTGILMVLALVVQFRTAKYVPAVYWAVVVLVSVFGTLVTDNMSDNFGVPLEVSTIVFFVALMATFFVWYLSEKTLSIHSIYQPRREAFYWLAILLTFALGTAAGDLLAERLGLGYLTTGVLILGLVATIAIAWRLKLDAILSFWMVYILTRPLGASLGDLLSQSADHGGLALGATNTSIIFLVAILVTVVYLSLTRRDLTPSTAVIEDATKPTVLAVQLTIVMILVVGGSLAGYSLRQGSLQQEAKVAAQPLAAAQPVTWGPLGDLTELQKIVDDTQVLVEADNLEAATKRVDDLEYWWDTAQAKLKPKSPTTWTTIDASIDKVLRQLRAVQPDGASTKAALLALKGLMKP